MPYQSSFVVGILGEAEAGCSTIFQRLIKRKQLNTILRGKKDYKFSLVQYDFTRFHLIDIPFNERAHQGIRICDVMVFVLNALTYVHEDTNPVYRYTTLAKTFGVQRYIFVINKMDATGFNQAVHSSIEALIRHMTVNLAINQEDVYVVPTFAKTKRGNTRFKSPRMSWYEGPTVGDVIGKIALPIKYKQNEAPLCAVITHMTNGSQTGQVFVTKVKHGTLKQGMTIKIGKETGFVSSIMPYLLNNTVREAKAGDLVGISLLAKVPVEGYWRGRIIGEVSRSTPAECLEFTAKVKFLRKNPTNGSVYVQVPSGCGQAEIIDFKIQNKKTFEVSIIARQLM
jgi:translation elongation factor EF-1alpha